MNDKNNNFIGNEEILYKEKSSLIFECKKGILFIIIIYFLITNMQIIIKTIGKIQNTLAKYIQIPLTEYITLFFMAIIFILVIWTIWILVKWINTEYTITNSRVLIDKGVLMKKSEFLPIQKIQDIETNKGLIGRIFKVGEVNIFSGYDEGSIKLKNIKNPDKVKNIIFAEMNKYYAPYRSPAITPDHTYQNQDINTNYNNPNEYPVNNYNNPNIYNEPNNYNDPNNYNNLNERERYENYQNQQTPGNIKQDHMIKHYNPQNPNNTGFSQPQKFNQSHYDNEFDNRFNNERNNRVDNGFNNELKNKSDNSLNNDLENKADKNYLYNNNQNQQIQHPNIRNRNYNPNNQNLDNNNRDNNRNNNINNNRNNNFYDNVNHNGHNNVKNYENENNSTNYNSQRDLDKKREFFEEDIPKYSKNRTKEEGQAIRNKHLNRFRKK